MHKKFFIYIIILFLSFTLNSSKKSKKNKENLPKYPIWKLEEIPSDKQIYTFIKNGENKTFRYNCERDNTSISIIVTTCSGETHFKIDFRSEFGATVEKFSSIISSSTRIIELEPQKGNYTLKFETNLLDSYVFIYISTEPEGPEALKNRTSLLLKNQRNDKLLIKWEHSLVDPQSTSYCLIISGSKHYGTLCGAQADRYGVIKPGTNYQRPVAASQTVISWLDERDQDKYANDLNIVCTGKHTQYTLQNAISDKLYYFDLFAIDHQTNFTYLYGSNSTKYKRIKSKPIALKDGQLKFINLKEFNGKAVFKFKVGKNSINPLQIFVMPCGGAVDVQITQNKEVIETKKMIESIGWLNLPKPTIGARYYIKIFSAHSEEFKRISGVQLYATAKSSAAISLPEPPLKLILHEYISLKSCNSVTIGWIPSSKKSMAYYCLVVKEGNLRDGYRMINQCGLENRLKKSADFIWKYCKNIKHNNQKVLTQRITRLKPGRSYIIQVTVKKPKGLTVSYELLQVNTKLKCKKD